MAAGVPSTEATLAASASLSSDAEVTAGSVPIESAQVEESTGDHNFEAPAESTGAAPDPEPEPEQEPEPEPAPPPSEYDVCWAAVKANTADFDAWCRLVQVTEKLDDIKKVREVYDPFLAEFPLCYGYWKKYADQEQRLGTGASETETHAAVVAVYERAVAAVAKSIDIWVHYVTYLIQKSEEPAAIRSVFERATAAVGGDYLAHPVWDKYLEWEASQQDVLRMSALYARILQLPLQQLERYNNNFKLLVSTYPVDQILTPEQVAAYQSSEAAPATVEKSENGDGGEESAPPPPPSSTGPLDKYTTEQEAAYRKAKEEEYRIREFEYAIKRPYFHVKALDDAQLQNWHRYLDLEEKAASLERTVSLYERCLVATALYPEFWVRYTLFLDREGKEECALAALERATGTFVKYKPEAFLFAAGFLERRGQAVRARQLLEHVVRQLAPRLLQAVVRLANFERRQGNVAGAVAAYEAAWERELGSDDSKTLPFLTIQFARFLSLVVGDADRARDVYMQALAKAPTSRPLWDAAIASEAHSGGAEGGVARVLALYEKVLSTADDAPKLTAVDRTELAACAVEYADLQGDVDALAKAEAIQRQHFPLHARLAESRKRAADGGDDDRGAKRYAAAGPAAPHGVMAAAPVGQAGATAGPAGGAWAGYGQHAYGAAAPGPYGQAAVPQQPSQGWHGGYGAAGSSNYGYGAPAYPPQQAAAAAGYYQQPPQASAVAAGQQPYGYQAYGQQY